jgi:hypothetical protein
VVPHHGTNWAALRLTAQIGRDAVLSESYGRGYKEWQMAVYILQVPPALVLKLRPSPKKPALGL